MSLAGELEHATSFEAEAHTEGEVIDFGGVGEGPFFFELDAFSPGFEVVGIVDTPLDGGTCFLEGWMVSYIVGGHFAEGVKDEMTAVKALMQCQHERFDGRPTQVHE